MFRFKQFTIQQDRTAMKVCTDACILGAYAPVEGANLLDIGTGTGLLALMAAQRAESLRVDAVEIDEGAYGQAATNVAASPFAERVRVWNISIQAFKPDQEGNYDTILTNPPFYTNHLRSPDANVNRALHNDELPFEHLAVAIQRLLKPDGQCWVLLPPFEMERFRKIAEKVSLLPFRQLNVRHHAQKPFFRQICGFSFRNLPLEKETLDIYETDGKTYSEPFRRLLQPFYLIF
ncbi:tRNA1(Val) (adenine(37)-N6)-methyltransferase [Tellurirhabdus bombi]|uniref:tRNA1(Val) (adenine(37)-N6)-methyltransferase n=1 Tax=Tellurirhabdus bombi TaxID=2907205 RepID=UPI001F20A2BC|nr:methyltransferase [Tellurirhabdus bombi]